MTAKGDPHVCVHGKRKSECHTHPRLFAVASERPGEVTQLRTSMRLSLVFL